MKKGRFSEKNVSNAERFTSAGSASTWPKSGLTAASSVRLGPSPILRSPPTRPLRFRPLSNGFCRSRLSFTVEAEATYGISSSRRAGLMPRIPRSVPIHDDQPLSFFGTGIQKTSSLRDGDQKSKFNPHSCSSMGLKRSCEKGMRISAVHPVASTLADACHTGSNESSVSYSLSEPWYQSPRTPLAATAKLYAVRRSRYVSSEIQ